MNNDLIRLSRKAANEWRNDDAYYQASVLIDSLCDMLENAPAVDAVEVVRCRNCKHGEVDDPDFPEQYLCHYTGGNWNMGDHFCGYAEPRMDGE